MQAAMNNTLSSTSLVQPARDNLPERVPVQYQHEPRNLAALTASAGTITFRSSFPFKY